MRYILLFLMMLPLTVFAKSNLELTAQKALEWEIGKQSVVAIGEAKVEYEGTTIRAERITGYYTENDGNKNFYKLVAIGDVKITSVGSVIETQKLVYDLNTQVLTLTGDPWTRLTHEKAILSSKYPLTFNNKTKQAVAKNAEIKHETRVLTAPTLTAYFSQDNVFEKAIAAGNITLKTDEETLESKAAVYDAKKGIATLTDKVLLTRKDGTTLKGGKLIYDMKRGVTRLHADPKTGKVIGIFEK
ncbi:MAG: hypothetical protein JW812_02860 [Alphaproteobacteria bacterium]|nr:hypothetical protein [Alphaproteobacteria bacterium]MBN2779973.1 hypothetical protein [Alphaproteobacteria bacterium]